MQTLRSLDRYNTWANARMYDAVRALDRATLEHTASGTTGSIQETVIHLVSVEDVYLARLKDIDLQAEFGSQEAYAAHDLAWFIERGRGLAAGYASLLDSAGDSWLEGGLHVRWFDFPLTRHDGLVQVYTHSAQHRSQVLSVIGADGIEVPDVDYVFMVGESERERTA